MFKSVFNGKKLNGRANLAKEIFVKYVQETSCRSEELLHIMQKYKIGKNAVKTEQEVKEIKERCEARGVRKEVMEFYPDHIYPDRNSFKTNDGAKMIVSTEFNNKTLNPIINFARDRGWTVEILS